ELRLVEPANARSCIAPRTSAAGASHRSSRPEHGSAGEGEADTRLGSASTDPSVEIRSLPNAGPSTKRTGSKPPPPPGLPPLKPPRAPRRQASGRGLLAGLIRRLRLRARLDGAGNGDHRHQIAIAAARLRRLEGAPGVHLAVGQARDLLPAAEVEIG